MTTSAVRQYWYEPQRRAADCRHPRRVPRDRHRRSDQGGECGSRAGSLRAAERLLEIIGEAASMVTDEVRAEYPGVDWRSITRLRIVLAHHYHRTDPDLIWSYAADNVPLLARALST